MSEIGIYDQLHQQTPSISDLLASILSVLMKASVQKMVSHQLLSIKCLNMDKIFCHYFPNIFCIHFSAFTNI
ncbi:hypothetical protein CICLE_v10004086mg [Citrus x clementina]|uniref:Uncharacterized protein n=1 Tax=Citrus clementina TaxID=85681 RepID=V4SJ17_CITCL|nr:hypothetical protein CICLE_v10004086mg [Citrus x clementina]